jgi:uncharacterized membrane protein
MPDEPGGEPRPIPSSEPGTPDLAARVAALEAAVASLQGQLSGRPATAPRSATPPLRPANLPAAAGPAPPAAAPASPRPDLPPIPPIPKTPARAKKGTADLEGMIAGAGNRIGLVAVAVGMSYFLKYAIDNDWIGPGGQVAIGLLVGSGCLLSTVWFLKRGYAYFSDGMTGLGAAILYLSLWAAGNYYQLLSLEVTFAAMALVTAGIIAIAALRNSQATAVMALFGGFMTPMLVSTGRDAEVMLFSYIAILDASLLPLARTRDWRAIELPAFLLTAMYFIGWEGRFYVGADQNVVTGGFAAVFFLLFAALPAIRSRVASDLRTEHAILIPLNAFACFGAFASLSGFGVHSWSLTVVALVLAAAHVLLAGRLSAEGRDAVRQLFAGVALTFASAAIPLRFTGHRVTAAWAIEAAVLMWTGLRTRLVVLRFFSIILFWLSGLVAGVEVLFAPTHGAAVANGAFVSALIVVVSFAVAYRLIRQHHGTLEEIENNVMAILGVGAHLLTWTVLTQQVTLFFEPTDGNVRYEGLAGNQFAKELAISILWTAYASILLIVGVKRSNAALRWMGLLLFGLTTLKVFFGDLSYLSGFYRIASSIGLGVVLLTVSFLYQRSLAARATSAEA